MMGYCDCSANLWRHSEHFKEHLQPTAAESKMVQFPLPVRHSDKDDDMSVKSILITGMSGLIGQIMGRALKGKYELIALNRRPVSGVRCFQADIGDLEAIRPAFDGVSVVLHLAALAVADAPWDGVLHNNIIGTYNVF